MDMDMGDAGSTIVVPVTGPVPPPHGHTQAKPLNQTTGTHFARCCACTLLQIGLPRRFQAQRPPSSSKVQHFNQPGRNSQPRKGNCRAVGDRAILQPVQLGLQWDIAHPCGPTSSTSALVTNRSIGTIGADQVWRTASGMSAQRLCTCALQDSVPTGLPCLVTGCMIR